MATAWAWLWPCRRRFGNLAAFGRSWYLCSCGLIPFTACTAQTLHPHREDPSASTRRWNQLSGASGRMGRRLWSQRNRAANFAFLGRLLFCGGDAAGCAGRSNPRGCRANFAFSGGLLSSPSLGRLLFCGGDAAGCAGRSTPRGCRAWSISNENNLLEGQWLELKWLRRKGCAKTAALNAEHGGERNRHSMAAAVFKSFCTILR